MKTIDEIPAEWEVREDRTDRRMDGRCWTVVRAKGEGVLVVQGLRTGIAEKETMEERPGGGESKLWTSGVWTEASLQL